MFPSLFSTVGEILTFEICPTKRADRGVHSQSTLTYVGYITIVFPQLQGFFPKKRLKKKGNYPKIVSLLLWLLA